MTCSPYRQLTTGTGSTDTRHTFCHSDTHIAKMVRKPMKVAMSARPLMVSMKPLPPPHRTETQKAEADQPRVEGSGTCCTTRFSTVTTVEFSFV
jgi:hypothetical protein